MNLTKLFQLLVKSNELSYIQLEHFIDGAKLHKEFKAAAKNVPSRVCTPILKLFIGKNQKLLELIHLFSLEEHQIIPLIENDYEFFCYLIEKDAEVFTISTMKKLPEKYRTQYLIVCLKQKNTEQALELLKSGSIDSTKISLSSVPDDLLYNINLLQSLLECGIDPKGKQSIESPLQKLASRCPHWPKKKLHREKQREITQAMKLLIDAGAEVRDLNNYEQSTPLHVATDLALATGKFLPEYKN